MKLFKLLLLLIALNMSAFAANGLTTDESKMMDSYIKDWPEKYQPTMKTKIDKLSVDSQKLIVQYYQNTKSILDTKRNLQKNQFFLYRLYQIAEASTLKDGRMEYNTYYLMEGIKKDYPEVTDQLKPLLIVAKNIDTTSGIAKPFDKEEIRKWFLRKLENDYVDGKLVGQKITCEGKLLEYLPAEINGRSNGRWEAWYENGQKRREGMFAHGGLEGVLKFWHENGKLQEESFFENGMRQGTLKRWYDNGIVKEMSNYKNDRKNGESKEYFENGQLKVTANYINDKIDGKYRMYYEDGKKYREIDYVNGEKNGEFLEWFRDGTLARDIAYQSDKLNGVFKVYDSNGQLAKDGVFADDISKYYKEYQTFGYIGAIKLESKRINENTVEFIEYRFRRDKDDKPEITAQWQEINGLKEGVYREYLAQKLRSEHIYKNGKIQSIIEYGFLSDDIRSRHVFNQTTNQTYAEEYFIDTRNKQTKGKIKQSYFYEGYPSLYGNKKLTGVYTKYGEQGNVFLQITYKNGITTKQNNSFENNINTIVMQYKNNRTKGLGYYWLDLEQQIGYDTQDAVKALDSIVKGVRSRVKIKSIYTHAEAVEILNIIGNELKQYGIIYGNNSNDVFSRAIIGKQMDCDLISYLYVTIGDKLNLPIYAVFYPEHVAVKWQTNDEQIYWEATSHKLKSLEEYKTWILNRWKATSPAYGEPLTREELMGAILAVTGSNAIGFDYQRLFYEQSNKYNLKMSLYTPRNGYNNNVTLNLDAMKKVEEQRVKIFGNHDLFNNRELSDYYYGAKLFLIDEDNNKDQLDFVNKKIIEYGKSYDQFPGTQFNDAVSKFGDTIFISQVADAYSDIGDYDTAQKIYEYLIVIEPISKNHYNDKLNKISKRRYENKK